MPCAQLVIVEQVERRDVALLDPLDRLVPRDGRALRMPQEVDAAKPALPSSSLSSSASGKRARSIAWIDGKYGRARTHRSAGVERHDDEPSLVGEDAAQLGERERPVDEVADEPHDGALEPAVAER